MVKGTLMVIFSILFNSCSNREQLVDKEHLTGDDYRIFQNTPAWELAKAVQDENETKINNIILIENKLKDYQDPIYGNTLLILTVKNQQYKPFETLLRNGVDVNVHNSFDGTSAIIEACSYRGYNIKFIKELVKNGANVNDVEVGTRRTGNTTRYSPLIAASKAGKIEFVDFLVKNGANVNYQNEYKQTALSEATIQEKLNVVIYLLNSGADYKTPIFYNSDDKREVYLVDELRKETFDLNSEQYKSKMEIVAFLLQKGIDYKKAPIPEYIERRIKNKYPNNWQEYLDRY